MLHLLHHTLYNALYYVRLYFAKPDLIARP